MGLWSHEEDAYNPMNFVPMVRGYIERCKSLGTASDDAIAFARKMGWEPAEGVGYRPPALAGFLFELSDSITWPLAEVGRSTTRHSLWAAGHRSRSTG